MREKGKITKMSKSYSIDKNLLTDFEKECNEKCTNASMLVEKLIKEHLEKNGKR